MNTFEKVSTVPATPGELFDWHARPGAFARLAPPWQPMEVLSGPVSLEEGSRVRLRLGRAPLALPWTAEHTWVKPGSGFEDVQVAGPFRRWRHRHLFEPAAGSDSLLRDVIEYQLPLGALGEWLLGDRVRRDLERTFDYRHKTTIADLALHRRYVGQPRLRVGLTGAGGMIGASLASLLTGGGHQVIRLTRSKASDPSGEGVPWDPEQGILESAEVEGLDVLVHLAGENISRRRWTAAQKRRILDSRVRGTDNLVRSLGRLERPPKTFLSASAIGIYGDRGDEPVDEVSTAGRGFLAEVCKGWEEAAEGASDWGARVVMARFGIVLTPLQGALAKMLPAFRLGAGGRLGDGRQFMSWISLDDVSAALFHILMTPQLRGPVNVVSPNPVRNLDFTQELGRLLHRPTVIPMPARLARMLFGEMAEELLLAGCRVQPRRLLASGFSFRHAELAPSLSFLLGLG